MNWIEWLLWSSVMLLIAYVCGAAVAKYIVLPSKEGGIVPQPAPDPLERMLPGEKLSFEPPLTTPERIAIRRKWRDERSVVVPKDVWAELQAMPNDGSWSTRQLVRAIQRANKKKGGKA